MSHILEKVGLVLLLPAFCSAQSLAPSDALNRYLARSRDRQPACSDLVLAVQIDASLPKLRKQGTMRGLKRVSQTGQIVYRSLRFTGDNFVKTAVTARFLAEEEEPRTGAADYAVTERNYSLVYEKTSDYNGMTAYVFRLKPRRKRVGLLRGELWLDANTAAPLRLWGDFVKSPSVYIRSFRLVQDYQNLGACSLPLRLLLMVQTRIVGKVEIAVWLHPADGQPATKGTAARGSDSDATQGFAHSSIQEKDGMTQ